MAQVNVFPELSILDICYSKAARSSVHENWKEGIRLTQGHLEMIEALLPQSCTVGTFGCKGFTGREKQWAGTMWVGLLHIWGRHIHRIKVQCYPSHYMSEFHESTEKTQ